MKEEEVEDEEILPEADSIEEEEEELSSSSAEEPDPVPKEETLEVEMPEEHEEQQPIEIAPVMSAEAPKEETSMSLDQIKASVAQRFEDLLECVLGEPEDDIKVRTTHMNIYESVFNIVVVDNIDLIECMPNVKLYWETPWAHVVTVRLIAKKEHFRVFLNLFQDTMNKMHQNDLLLVPVLPYHSKGH